MRIESEFTTWDDALHDDVTVVIVMFLERDGSYELDSARIAHSDIKVDGRLLKAAETHAEELAADGDCESFLDD